MNKAKRARWCNPLEGVGTEKKGLRFWVLQLLGEGGGLACKARAVGHRPPSIYEDWLLNNETARLEGALEGWGNKRVVR